MSRLDLNLINRIQIVTPKLHKPCHRVNQGPLRTKEPGHGPALERIVLSNPGTNLPKTQLIAPYNVIGTSLEMRHILF